MVFFSFLVAIPFSFYWIYLSIKNNNNIFLDFVFSCFLFITHAIAWGLGVFFIFIIYFLKRKNYKNFLTRITFVLIPLFFAFAWVIYSASHEASASDLPFFSYHDPVIALAQLSGGELMGNDKFFGSIKLILILASLFFFCERERNDNLFIHLTIAALLLYFTMPTVLLSTGYFSDRLAIFLPFFYIMTFNTVVKEKSFLLCSCLASLIMIGSEILHINKYSDDIKSLRTNSSIIQNESRIFYISSKDDYSEDNFEIFNIPYYLHFGAWIQNEKNVIVDYNFAYFYTVMVRYKENNGINSKHTEVVSEI